VEPRLLIGNIMLLHSQHVSKLLAIAALVTSFPGAARLAAQAQAKDACSLLRPDEVQSVAPSTAIGNAVSTNDNLGSVVCTYRWSTGKTATPAQYAFQIVNGDPSRMFPAMSEAQIKEALLRPAKQNQADASLVSGIGDAAVFKSESPTKSDVTAFLKGRIVTLSIEAPDARNRKDQLVALLKLASGRL